LISRHKAEPFASSFVSAAGAADSSVFSGSLVLGTESFSLLLQPAGGQDHESLSPGMIVGHRQMYVDGVAFRRKGVKPRPGPAGEL
jgi:hypothetical protein